MAEETKVTVPIGLNEGPAQPAPDDRPLWARKSLHSVRLPRRQVELAPTWEMNGPSPEVKWQPVEQSTEPEATSPQYTQPYQQPGVNYMEDQSSGQQPQQTSAAQPPDPASYDLYDSNDVARFHQDNSAYYQQMVDSRVQSHLAPHMSALREAELRRDYNAAVERYGEDGNFQDVMKVALDNCAEADRNGKRFSIVEEYQKANDKTAARPGQRGIAHLPEAFRDKRRGISMLGRIMEHNQQTGRSKR